MYGVRARIRVHQLEVLLARGRRRRAPSRAATPGSRSTGSGTSGSRRPATGTRASWPGSPRVLCCHGTCDSLMRRLASMRLYATGTVSTTIATTSATATARRVSQRRRISRPPDDGEDRIDGDVVDRPAQRHRRRRDEHAPEEEVPDREHDRDRRAAPACAGRAGCARVPSSAERAEHVAAGEEEREQRRLLARAADRLDRRV